MGSESNEGLRGYRVLDREVYPSLGRVVRIDEEAHLEPRVMDLLVFFAEHPGEVLSRETIVDAVWAEQFVGEAVIRQSVAAIRKALGDDAHEPRFIETIPKRGYRLIASVERLGATEGATGEVAIGEPDSVPVIGRPLTVEPDGPSEFQCTLRYGKRSVRLTDGENIIGRTPDARVQIASERVSRRHARIVVDGEQAVLEDLGSKNGTFVRGERIHGPVELTDGDEIGIGRVILIFHGLYTARTATDHVPGDDG
jgi:DNA-binding winged helix-turn-helix (wHTH) protein